MFNLKGTKFFNQNWIISCVKWLKDIIVSGTISLPIIIGLIVMKASNHAIHIIML